MLSQTDLVKQAAARFCLEFVCNPYLCYTEHGLHALFFTRLYNSLAEVDRYITWCGNKVCALQKEYPTKSSLGKPKRQHWDIALIENQQESILAAVPCSYDFLRLAVVVEFGLNEAEAHLRDDIHRLSHADANVDQGLLVHLYRLSQPGALFSHRDWSASSKKIVTKEKIADMLAGTRLEAFYAMVDSTGTHPPGAFWITKDSTLSLPVSRSR